MQGAARLAGCAYNGRGAHATRPGISKPLVLRNAAAPPRGAGGCAVVGAIFEQRIRQLTPQQLSGGLRGVERECLRVTPDGRIAPTAHPQALGSALANRYITTDFSEALLELITPPAKSNHAVGDWLAALHEFVLERIGSEHLWPASMPPEILADEELPPACYGTSNIGRLKHVYRLGLANRYGPRMQAIAGIHFNYSPAPEFWGALPDPDGLPSGMVAKRSSWMMGQMRNVRRLAWLPTYLLGASPAFHSSLSAALPPNLKKGRNGALYAPHATSLRMSSLGYTSALQAGLVISANHLHEYVRDLEAAIHAPHAGYARIGVRANGEYRQLSDSVLQVENEYYSPARPKRRIRRGERAATALRRRGVEYLELRLVDADPFEPLGVSAESMRLMEAFLLYCLLEESPCMSAAEHLASLSNLDATAWRGRSGSTKLFRDGKEVSLRAWGLEVCDSLAPICEALDVAAGGCYGKTLRAARERLRDPALTPAARVLEELRQAGWDQQAWGMEKTLAASKPPAKQPPNAARRRALKDEAAASLKRQHSMESQTEPPFAPFLARYLGRA